MAVPPPTALFGEVMLFLNHCGSADWSAPLLFSNPRREFFSRHGPHNFLSTFRPLKRQEKIHLKMSSAEVVRCKYLPNINDEFKYRSKQCGPRTDYSYRNSLIWVHTVCHRGFLHISADEKNRRLLMRLALLG